MEIRTCEQYVLNELDKAHTKIDELIDKNIEKEAKLIEAQTTIDELDGYILKVTRVLEAFYNNTRAKPYAGGGFIYNYTCDRSEAWNEMDKAYEEATEILKKERESDSEE